MRNLDPKSVAGSQLLNGIIKAAGVHVTTAHLKDSFRINSRSNTVSVLTDNSERARKYAEIKDFPIHGKKVEVYGHGTTPGKFRRIVDVNEAEMLEHLIRCNPHTTIIDAKRMGRSPSVLITLGTQESPGYIKFLCGFFPFHDYRETKQECTSCWKLGHRADACPTPNTGRCPNCGEIHSHPARVKGVRTVYDCTPRCLIYPCEKANSKKEDFLALTPQADKTKATTDQTKNYSQALRKQGGGGGGGGAKKPTEQNPLQNSRLSAKKSGVKKWKRYSVKSFIRRQLQRATGASRRQDPIRASDSSETLMPPPPTPLVEQESMQVEERTTRKRGQRTESECTDASAVTDSEGPKARRVESSPASNALLERLAKAVRDMQESTAKSITAFQSTLTAFDERLHKIEEYIGLLQQSVKNQMNPKPATQNGK
ncbi:hypothetical protein HPB47_008573 [Ixodes persulcatus]|uniref:Uncharacterized protein n=1 Tax=Ixodes persulcatus TaxID=34615 RepID=A0AC60P4F3_IXOPE|nr:hypothetical protein HPB47_008573 [Ixodes persulcatus]